MRRSFWSDTARRLGMALTLCAGFAGAGGAQTVCEAGNVTVLTQDPAQAAFLCNSVASGLSKLAACNVTLHHPVTVELRDRLSAGCMGVYHCGEDRIELLTPEAMAATRNPDGRLAFVETQTYFHSILVHELAHAAYAEVPCPFGSCLATNEYVANTMQVMSLPAADIARLEADLDMETRLSRDSLNPFLYLMAPDIFLRKAWVHLNQRPDPCAYIGQIMAGRVLLDYERYD